MSRPSWRILLAVVLASCRPAEPAVAPSVVEVRAPAAPEVDPEHTPLTDGQIDNLVAFTRLLGYVRYFHPSDAALVADWDALAVRGAGLAEAPGTPRELARMLGDVFRPVAPTVVVHPTGTPSAQPPGLLPPPGAAVPPIVAWRHDGLGTGATRVFTSRRIDDRPGRHAEPGALVQTFDARPYRGKHVRARAAVRAEVGPPPEPGPGIAPEPEPGVVFGLRATLPGGLMGMTDEAAERSIVEREWRRYDVSGTVDDDAETLSVGLYLTGEGRAAIDDVSLDIVDPKGDEPIALVNPGFEEGEPGTLPLGWSAPDAARLGYRVEISRERPQRGRASGAITAVPLPAEVLPPPAQTFHADLGAGVACEVPLTLYFSDGATLPRVPWPWPYLRDSGDSWPGGSQAQNDRRRPRGPFAHDPRERATRLASVAVLWSALSSFYPYFDVVHADWPAALRTALARAAVDRDERASLATLRRLMAALHDGHGAVDLEQRNDEGALVPFEHEDRALPIVWDWVEGRLVVTAVRRPSVPRIQPGDVVTAIDGVPAKQAADALLAEVSAATAQHARVKALQRLRIAPRGRAVVLSVEPRAGAPYTLRVEHDLPVGQPPWVSEPRPAPVEELEPGIVYVDLERVDDDAFQNAVPMLWAARGIVFDLRGDPSRLSLAPLRHLIDAPVENLRGYIPHITRPDREGMTFTLQGWIAAPMGPRFEGKVAFLADARTVGYAETCLAVAERYRLGEIVGEPTAGTSGNVDSVRLPGGFTATFTGMKVLGYDGTPHHGVGIHPTIPVSRTIAAVAAGTDEVLARAVVAVR